MNIVIPMVGMGKRFSEVGFKVPKPLILVKGKTIVERAVKSFDIDANFIFIIRKTEYSERLSTLLKNLNPFSTILETDKLTDGSVNSILLAEHLINNDVPLITTNCDQEVIWDVEKFIKFCEETLCDGAVVTYPYPNIKLGEKSPYSFIKLDENSNGAKLEEKFAISDKALCGIHYWKKGKDFVSSAKELILANDRVNNEFYVSKTYNYLINKGKLIKTYPLETGQFFSLGTPEDVLFYESTNNSVKENESI